MLQTKHLTNNEFIYRHTTERLQEILVENTLNYIIAKQCGLLGKAHISDIQINNLLDDAFENIEIFNEEQIASLYNLYSKLYN
jgi:hypothetical protein